MDPDSKEPSKKPIHRFKPGESGNPGGKNPERERLRKYILDSYGQEAIDGIATMARAAKSAKVRLEAYIWLAEQTVGKAVQAITGPDGAPVVDVESLAVTLRRIAGEDDAQPG